MKEKVKFASDLKIHVNFVEISPVLARKQAETLGAKIDWVGGPEDKCFMKVTAQKFNYTQFVFYFWFFLTENPIRTSFWAENKASTESGDSISWCRSLSDVPPLECITFAICHEFLDALPVHQFELDQESEKWREVLVDIDEDKEMVCLWFINYE